MKKIRSWCLGLCILFVGLAAGHRAVRTRRRTGSRQGRPRLRRRIGGRGGQGTYDGGFGQGRSGRHDHRNNQRRAGGRFQGRRHAAGHGQPSRPKQDRHQLCVDAGDWLPGHVHAGGIRHGGIRALPGEEREPHVHDELLRVHGGVVLLLACRLCHTNGRRGRQRKPGRPAVADSRAHARRYSARHGDCSADRECFSPATRMTSA